MQINRFSFYLSAFPALFCLIFLCSFYNSHPFYVSMTEIRTDTLSGKMTVSCRMFTDDLQDALYRLHGVKKEIIPGETDEEIKKALAEYIGNRLKIAVGNEKVNLVFSGYESEEESTWCHLEGKFSGGSTRIKIENKLLFDFLPGQTNMIHCWLQNKRQSWKLSNPDSSVVLTF
jgi:hypothetical protein